MTEYMDQIKINADGTIFVNGKLSNLRVSLDASKGTRTLKWSNGLQTVKLDDVTRTWHDQYQIDRVIRHHLAGIGS